MDKGLQIEAIKTQINCPGNYFITVFLTTFQKLVLNINGTNGENFCPKNYAFGKRETSISVEREYLEQAKDWKKNILTESGSSHW